ncbi:response regulator transcription factor [Leptolyngbya sp. FACHB-711]|uniref:response regulator transcription factor n=1 Tax=unclassified Leptolyngbya TaxID=2650499 RepID=UPI0016875B64|nr:response regulator transcription factor [Leptolyngbya sp. FACHB-711]MBD1852300.1 response regulator transcription factor [Cyanobacteria bacterium FACHB-502]MBD2023847.1 response regulator transcription factor [Leptolyngbya sp. FACHB-711]
MQRQILVIENDLKIAQIIQLELTCEGYLVKVVHDRMAGLLEARQSDPDLLILGWEQIGLSCLDICHRLRSTQNNVPILVLTKEGQVHDRVASLEAGADTCLTKPFNLEELVSVVRSLLRRTQPQQPYVLEFENLVLDRKARQVRHDYQQVELTAKEFDLLEYFMSYPKQVLRREQILQNVWGYDFVGDSNVIEVYIRYLRLKLGGSKAARLIHTVRGVGYVLRGAS